MAVYGETAIREQDVLLEIKEDLESPLQGESSKQRSTCYKNTLSQPWPAG